VLTYLIILVQFNTPPPTCSGKENGNITSDA